MQPETIVLSTQISTLLKIPSDHTPHFIHSSFALIKQDKDLFIHILDRINSLESPYDFADFLDKAIFNPLSLNTNPGRILVLINTCLLIFDYISVKSHSSFLPVLKFKLFIVLSFTCKPYLHSQDNFPNFLKILHKTASQLQESDTDTNIFLNSFSISNLKDLVKNYICSPFSPF